MEESNKEILNDKHKLAIRNYMLKTVALPGVVLAIICGLAGYFINDIATQKAYYQAFDRFQSQYLETINKAIQAVANLSAIQDVIKKKHGELERDFQKVKEIRAYLDSIDFSEEAAKYLSKNPDFFKIIIKEVNSKVEKLIKVLSNLETRFDNISKQTQSNVSMIDQINQMLPNMRDRLDKISKETKDLSNVTTNYKTTSQETQSTVNILRDELSDLRKCFAFNSIKFDSKRIGVGEGNVKQVDIKFKKPCMKAPKVIVTPRGEVYPDTFAVTTHHVTKDGFKVNVFRAGRNQNSQYWQQDLIIDWIAFVD